jgi:hemerythrin
MLIEWKKEWEIGIKDIDYQHIRLIDLLNKIQSNNIGNIELVKNLVNYVSNHFNDEEKLMVAIEYPYNDYVSHRDEHRKFTRIMLDISFEIIDKKVDNDKIDNIISKLKVFCFKWLDFHFLITDKKIADFIQEIGKNSVK